MPATKKSRSKKPNPYDSKKIAEEEAEEQALSTLLFGNQSDHPLVVPNNIHVNEDNVDDEEEIESDDNNGNLEKDPNLDIAPVWVDDDDARLTVNVSTGKNRLRKLRKTEAEQVLDGNEYEERLRARFETSHYGVSTQWANANTEANEEVYGTTKEEDDDDVSVSFEGVLQDSAPVLGYSLDLSPNIIEMNRCRDVNFAEPSDVTIQAINFHSSGEVVLTAGFDKALRFFRVDGEKNPKISGIYLENFPIHSASFLGKSGKVVVSSRRPHYYIYDSIVGKLDRVDKILGRNEKSLERFVSSPDGEKIAFIGNDGYMIVVDSHSKQRIGTLKMNGSVRALTFSENSNYLFGTGTDGDIYKFDLRTWRCTERFNNVDGTTSKSISVSSKYIAVGADSGVVNIYNDSLSSGSIVDKQPVKSIMNLQTTTDLLKFNSDGNILAMSSRKAKDSLKLFHVPTMSVFSNWPTSRTPLGYVWSMDFSPNSGYLAIGNTKGKCLLYKVAHYANN